MARNNARHGWTQWDSPHVGPAALVAGLCAMGFAGCASDHIPSAGPSRSVAVQAFSSGDDAAHIAPQSTSAPSPAQSTPNDTAASAPAAPQNAVTSTEAPENPADVAATPSSISRRRQSAGDEAVVESVIGQVSGRPIFADEFLEPIADQLRSEGERLAETEFIQSAQQIINKRLQEVVLNELVLAEAEASLSEQEQMGLLAFLRDLQEKTIAQAGGTIFGAEKKVIEEEEMTLEEYEEAQKDSILIYQLLNKRVEPRVIVAWRDVQREYELRKTEFNPPASVTFLRLQLDDAEQAALIEQAKLFLGSGKAFNDVVNELALSEHVSVLGGGAMRMGPGGISDVEVNEAFKPALAKLKGEQGEVTEFIARQGRTVWLYVDKIEQPPPKSLYQVQTQLIAELRARRMTEERNKYIKSLTDKGIYDELEVMARRVLMVAILRYGPM